MIRDPEVPKPTLSTILLLTNTSRLSIQSVKFACSSSLAERVSIFGYDFVEVAPPYDHAETPTMFTAKMIIDLPPTYAPELLAFHPIRSFLAGTLCPNLGFSPSLPSSGVSVKPSCASKKAHILPA